MGSDRLIEWDKLIAALAARRPIFHSEADLQHELALEIRQANLGIQCRLEVPLFPERNAAVDLCLRTDFGAVGVEIKHLTKACAMTVSGEHFVLKNQSARDIRSYDTVKDIQRIEELLGHRKIVSGGVLCLTNDPAYWKGSIRQDTNAAEFSLQEGRVINGVLRWGTATGPGTMKRREKPIRIAGSYQASWKNYSVIDGVEFRYLWVPVTVAAPVQPIGEVEPKLSLSVRAKSKKTGHAERIFDHLNQSMDGICDDCLSGVLQINPRQTINQNCRQLQSVGRLKRAKSSCSGCKNFKIVNSAIGQLDGAGKSERV
jgi:hypothetical protein